METKVINYNTRAIKALEKFKSKDKTRDYLMDVYYNDKTHTISATDGKICGKIEGVVFDVDKKGGLFTVKVISKNDILLTESNLGYPNIVRIFPDYEKLEDKGVSQLTIDLTGNKAMTSQEISIFVNKAKHIVNFRYLLDFPKELFTSFEKEKSNTLLFRSRDSSIGDLSIVLMAINL